VLNDDRDLHGVHIFIDRCLLIHWWGTVRNFVFCLLPHHSMCSSDTKQRHSKRYCKVMALP